MKNYYKVASIDGSRYFGSYIKDKDDPNRIEYKLNKPTKSKNDTPIFIFDTLENAAYYASIYNHLIFECKAKNVREPYKNIACMNIWVQHYWDTAKKAANEKSAENYIRNKLTPFIIPPPKGTLWADEITLTKQIQ